MPLPRLLRMGWRPAVIGGLALICTASPPARAAEAAPAAAAPAPTTPTEQLKVSRTNLLAWRDADGSERRVATAAEWPARRAAILAAMESIMGPGPKDGRRAPPAMELIEEVDGGSYVRRLIHYAADHGPRVPAYLLIPKAALRGETRAPAVLALHQTRPEGQKVVVGLTQSPDDEYGIHLAERGFVVLAPPYTMLANYWPDPKALGYRSGTMKSIWDNVRGLDLLASLPFVRTNGFGAIGHSLGGHNGLFTAAFDPRILAVVSSCGLDSFRDYYRGDPKVWQPGRGWCQDRYMPALAAYAGRLETLPFDFPEILAAIAPRACFISAPIADDNFRWQSVAAVARAAQPVFSLLGQPSRLKVVHPPVPHRFPPDIREQAYAWLREHLSPPEPSEDLKSAPRSTATPR